MLMAKYLVVTKLNWQVHKDDETILRPEIGNPNN
jgi:hypothetical protein